MARVRERALVEARARGLDLAAATKHRWKQMLHVNTVLSPIAINLFLVIYFTAVAYFVFYLVPFIWTMTGRWSPARARAEAAEHEARIQAELDQLKEPAAA